MALCPPAGRRRDASGNGEPAHRPAGGRRRRRFRKLDSCSEPSARSERVRLTGAAAARDPLPPSEPVPLPVHAQPGVPSRRQAPRLPRGRNHARQGEEAPQPGRVAGHHPGAEPRVPQRGESWFCQPGSGTKGSSCGRRSPVLLLKLRPVSSRAPLSFRGPDLSARRRSRRCWTEKMVLLI